MILTDDFLEQMLGADPLQVREKVEETVEPIIRTQIRAMEMSHDLFPVESWPLLGGMHVLATWNAIHEVRFALISAVDGAPGRVLLKPSMLYLSERGRSASVEIEQTVHGWLTNL